MNDSSLLIQNRVIYIDDDILIIDKPAGVLSIPDGYHPEYPHLLSLLQPTYGKLYIVHRLDKETSGVITLARNASSHKALNLQFDSREVHKHYKALIFGCPDWKNYNIDSPLTVNADRHHRTRVVPDQGKPASTEISVIQRWHKASLVMAEPHTGYTHQIRSHLGSIGFPIMFDKMYTPPDIQSVATTFYHSLDLDENSFRPMLHAEWIAFHHPSTDKQVEFSCPLPDDFQNLIQLLNK